MFKSGNWLHSPSVGTQWVEEKRAAVDAILDTNLARMLESCQNDVRVMPVSQEGARSV